MKETISQKLADKIIKKYNEHKFFIPPGRQKELINFINSFVSKNKPCKPVRIHGKTFNILSCRCSNCLDLKDQITRKVIEQYVRENKDDIIEYKPASQPHPAVFIEDIYSWINKKNNKGG